MKNIQAKTFFFSYFWFTHQAGFGLNGIFAKR